MQKRKTAWALALLLTLLPVGALAAGETPTESQGEVVAAAELYNDDGALTETKQFSSLSEAIQQASDYSGNDGVGVVQLLANTPEPVAVNSRVKICRTGLDGSYYTASGLTAGDYFVRITTEEAYTFYPEGLDYSYDSSNGTNTLTGEYSSATALSGTLYVAAYNDDGKMLAVGIQSFSPDVKRPEGDGGHISFELKNFIPTGTLESVRYFLLDNDTKKPLVDNREPD